jgi:hypothetical protein
MLKPILEDEDGIYDYGFGTNESMPIIKEY